MQQFLKNGIDFTTQYEDRAGGSKSFTCLLKALKYVQDPAARVVIVRESYPTLKLSGGLWDESHNIYPHFGATPKVQRLTWVFKNGATIQFAALPDNLDEWRGMQATNFLVDESATFKESQILFLLSRLRSATYKGHMNLVMTCNPDASSFLAEWTRYSWEGTEDGVPRAGTENITRYFVQADGGVKWGDSPEELYEKYGQGKEFGVNFNPTSFKFYPLTVHDNPTLLKNNPAYLDNLLNLPLLEQLVYYKGSWTAQDRGALLFSRDWCELVNYVPESDIVARVRAWDFAASEPSATGSNSNPDYTAGVLISKDKYGNYYIEDVKRFRYRTEKVLKEVINTANSDGLDVNVCIPTDTGAAGKVAAQYYLRVLAENGVYAKTKVVSGHSSKMVRFKPFCALAESGHLKVVRAEWNDVYFNELENFKDDKASQRKSKDDMVDATSDGFAMLARTQSLPTFSMPSLTQSSPIPTI